MRWLIVLGLVFAASAVACLPVGDQGPASPSAQEKPQSPTEVADRFLRLWQEKRYSEMYDLIASESQAAITRDKFVGRYQAIAEEATITGIDYELEAGGDQPMEVPVTVTIHTSFFGDIVQANAIPVVREEVEITPASPDKEPEVRQEWRVVWHPSLIFKELDEHTLVHFFTRVPRRGAIYDRNGKPLAIDAKVTVIGAVPDLITDAEELIATLASKLDMPAEEIRAIIEADVPSYYFLPIKTLPYGTKESEIEPFYDLADMGVVVREETQRVYPNGDSAAHILGYLTEVTAEQLEELAPLGFKPGDLVGAFGLEGAFEEELRGQRGATLATITPEGTIARTIIEKPEKAGRDLYLAIDIDVQKTAEAALGQRVGSIVVMDPRDNSVLALASYPRFDPNDFIKGLTPETFDRLNNDPRQPFLHRPLLATYPPGSTFKVVTAAAGLEKGGFSPGSALPCPPIWYGLGEEFAKRNWQSVHRGYLTAAEGLMASCNPVFYEMALTLDLKDPDILPSFARAFGFGQPTGIQGLPEAAGVAPSPDWKEKNLGEPWYSGDSVNMGIGQGFLAVTPLQIANAYSAIADGAVLRQPLLVTKIASADGTVAREFAAEVINELPISSTTLSAIREGLRLVTQSPGGTSYRVFLGSSVDAVGKSGTAEDLGFGSDHVFFVAYANRSSPSVLALAALEEGRSGSVEAGPMVREILETYLGATAASNP